MRSSEFFLRSDDRPGRGVARRKPWRGVVAPGTIRARGSGEEGEACGSEKRPKHPSGTFAKPTALSGSTAKRAGRGVLVRTRSGLAGPRGVVPGARPNVNFGLPGVGVDGGGSRMCGCPACTLSPLLRRTPRRSLRVHVSVGWRLVFQGCVMDTSCLLSPLRPWFPVNFSHVFLGE